MFDLIDCGKSDGSKWQFSSVYSCCSLKRPDSTLPGIAFVPAVTLTGESDPMPSGPREPPPVIDTHSGHHRISTISAVLEKADGKDR